VGVLHFHYYTRFVGDLHHVRVFVVNGVSYVHFHEGKLAVEVEDFVGDFSLFPPNLEVDVNYENRLCVPSTQICIHKFDEFIHTKFPCAFDAQTFHP